MEVVGASVVGDLIKAAGKTVACATALAGTAASSGAAVVVAAAVAAADLASAVWLVAKAAVCSLRLAKLTSKLSAPAPTVRLLPLSRALADVKLQFTAGNYGAPAVVVGAAKDQGALAPLIVMPSAPLAPSLILPAIVSESPLPSTVMATLLFSITPTSEVML